MNDNLFKEAFDAIDDELLSDAKNPIIRIAARRKKIIVSSIAACVAAVLVAVPSIKVLSNLDDNKITTKPETEVEYEYEYEEQIIHRPSTSSKTSKPQNSQVSSEPKKESTSDKTQTDQNPSKPESTSSKNTTSSIKKTSKKTSSKRPVISKGPTSSKMQTGTKGPSYTSSNKPSGIDLSDDIKINLNDIISELASWNAEITTYEEVCVPSEEYLYIKPIPTEKYTTIYEYFPFKKWSKTEFCDYVDKYIPKIAVAIGIPSPSYNIEERYSGEYIVSTECIYISDNKYLSFSEPNLTICGETVVIDRTKSDSEILEGLSNVQEKLGTLFDTAFEISTIHREFSSSGDSTIHVEFYPKDYSSNLIISFYTESTWLNYFVSNREDPANSISKQVEILPLEKAEEYLNKGYVLASGCPQCQAEQSPVEFSNYDYVSFSYSTAKNIKIPYYQFYKNIGTDKNGNMIFAKTLVPAIEIEGYEEYFINKHNNHNNSTNNNDYVLEDNGQ